MLRHTCALVHTWSTGRKTHARGVCEGRLPGLVEIHLKDESRMVEVAVPKASNLGADRQAYNKGLSDRFLIRNSASSLPRSAVAACCNSPDLFYIELVAATLQLVDQDSFDRS